MLASLLGLGQGASLADLLRQFGGSVGGHLRLVEVGDVLPCRDRINPRPTRLRSERDGGDGRLELGLPEAVVGQLDVPVVGGERQDVGGDRTFEDPVGFKTRSSHAADPD